MARNETTETPKKEPKWRARFLAALANSGNVLVACKASGAGRATVYRHKDRFPRFRRAWDNAVEESTDILEAEARRRSVNGIDKPIFFKGKQVASVKEYSDTLLIFLLKAHRPEKFRDNYDIKRLADEFLARGGGAGEPPAGPTPGDRGAAGPAGG